MKHSAARQSGQASHGHKGNAGRLGANLFYLLVSVRDWSHHRKHWRGSDNPRTLAMMPHRPCDRGRSPSARPCECTAIFKKCHSAGEVG